MKKIVIIGAGAMGSAFTVPCADNRNEVILAGSFLEDDVIEHINKMTYIPKVGDVLNGEVVRILDFGAFVKITPNKDGLVHISEIKKERVNKVEDHLNIGDNVDVKIIKVDKDNGKISLSIKALL